MTPKQPGLGHAKSSSPNQMFPRCSPTAVAAGAVVICAQLYFLGELLYFALEKMKLCFVRKQRVSRGRVWAAVVLMCLMRGVLQGVTDCWPSSLRVRPQPVSPEGSLLPFFSLLYFYRSPSHLVLSLLKLMDCHSALIIHCNLSPSGCPSSGGELLACFPLPL